MKRVLLLAFMYSAGMLDAYGQSKLLKNFDQLMFALRTGSEVRAVIYYSRCKLVVDSVEAKAPDMIGGLSFDTFEYFGPNTAGNLKAYVETSQSVLISDPKHGFVDNYIRIRIYEDAEVEIDVRFLNVATRQVIMRETFYGRISSGDDGNPVCLYEQ